MGGTLSPADRPDPAGMQQRGVPYDHGAPVVADEHRLLHADLIEQGDKVAGQRMDVVVLDGVGSAGAAVPALVGGEHVIAGVRENRDLVPPRIRQFRESMGQHDHGCTAFSGFDDPKRHPVRLDYPFGRGVHDASQAHRREPWFVGLAVALRFPTAHRGSRRRTFDEPEKCNPHTHRGRGGAVAGLVVLLLQ